MVKAYLNNFISLRQLLCAAGMVALVTACASNPTGGANFVLMSESTEIEKGRELHQEMLNQNQVYNDAELVAYVNRIGQKMAAISHRPELEYVFTVIDSPDINAFALPGGFVYVNRGLLTYLNSEAQLAADTATASLPMWSPVKWTCAAGNPAPTTWWTTRRWPRWAMKTKM